MALSDARLAALKTDERTCIYSSLSGRSSQDFFHRLIRAHVLTYYFIISQSVF